MLTDRYAVKVICEIRVPFTMWVALVTVKSGKIYIAKVVYYYTSFACK